MGWLVLAIGALVLAIGAVAAVLYIRSDPPHQPPPDG